MALSQQFARRVATSGGHGGAGTCHVLSNPSALHRERFENKQSPLAVEVERVAVFPFGSNNGSAPTYAGAFLLTERRAREVAGRGGALAASSSPTRVLFRFAARLFRRACSWRRVSWRSTRACRAPTATTTSGDFIASSS